jgi:Tol biopolymer transport system component
MIASAQLVGNDGKSYKSDYTEGTGDTQFFTDGTGRTLYAFANSTNKNNFTKPDFSNDGSWPIYTADLKSPYR